MIFADFNKVYPNIKVDAVPIAASTWTTYADAAILQMAGGRQFDVLQSAINVQRLMVTKGIVAPLDEFIERDKAQLAPYFADENPKFLAWNKSLISKGWPDVLLARRLQHLLLLGQHGDVRESGCPCALRRLDLGRPDGGR